MPIGLDYVASYNLGQIYHFDLNADRTGLKLPTTINNRLVENFELRDMIFAHGLGKITDMDVGLDGNLYVLSRYFNTPTIFRISSVNQTK